MIEKKFVEENIKKHMAEEYLRKMLRRSGIVEVNIQRTPISTRIGIKAEKPGLIIGRKGRFIKEISQVIEKELGFENPQIEVYDVPEKEFEPAIVARWIAGMIARGIKPKRAIQRALYRVMNAGAIGCEIIVKGKLAGKGSMARKEKAKAGYIKKAGDPVKLVKEHKEQLLLKQGVVGITVRIVPPGVVFPDKIEIGGNGGDYKEKGVETNDSRGTPEETQGTGNGTPEGKVVHSEGNETRESGEDSGDKENDSENKNNNA